MEPCLIAAVRLSYDNQFWETEDTFVLRRQSRLNVAIFAGNGINDYPTAVFLAAVFFSKKKCAIENSFINIVRHLRHIK